MDNNGWISAVDQLPAPGQLCWYITSNRDVFIGARVRGMPTDWLWVKHKPEFSIFEGRIEAYVDGITSDATHWHPIPELPKIEK